MCDKNLVFPAIIKKDGNGYMVTFPDLDGCFSDGENLVEAFLNARDALALFLHENNAVPAPTTVEELEAGEDEYIMLITPDEENNIEYIEQVDVKDVINKALEKKGFTKYRVAKLLGISESHVSRIVSGERTPSTSIAQKLSELLEFDWRLFYT